MRTAHTLLAQALAAYDAADASWKPAEWFESVRACLALPPVIAHPGAAAKSFDEKFLNLDDRRVRGYYIEGWCDCAARHIPSPAWCASVDAELAATADADAQPVVPELLTDAVVRRGWQHTFSTENPFCPCDLKSFTKAVRWAEMKMLTDLKTQHASDSKELRRLCQERDDLRRANSLHKVNTAALESSVGHLSTLVDELRRLLGAAMQTMTELHGSAAPDESTADIDARIPGAAFAKFVNDHAQLLFEIKNGCAAAPTPTLPAAAVAEGAQLDGDSLEQGE